MNSLCVTANSRNCLQKEKKNTSPTVSLFQTPTNDSSKDRQELTFVIADAREKKARERNFAPPNFSLTNLSFSLYKNKQKKKKKEMK